MVGFQDIIVYLILAVVAVVIVYSIYRRLKGKDSGCNCHSCPHYGEECHCHDTQK
ncbi:MAG: FeoB-associated Cys-rich membrane protein [Bacteroidaceae bacterium]|nr:FeoB-associated Cys-rich membrane protein [Bacteroidaceae bacterium]